MYCVSGGMSSESLLRVFNVLDPTNTGWVALSELGYLETFESGLADFMAEREQQAPLLAAASTREPMLPPGVWSQDSIEITIF